MSNDITFEKTIAELFTRRSFFLMHVICVLQISEVASTEETPLHVRTLRSSISSPALDRKGVKLPRSSRKLESTSPQATKEIPFVSRTRDFTLGDPDVIPQAPPIGVADVNQPGTTCQICLSLYSDLFAIGEILVK